MFCCYDIPVLTALGGALMDARSSKIDNGWILSGILSGLAAHTIQSGPLGFFSGLAGCILPVLLLAWLFPLGMLGAGDVKLLCALGCALGPKGILTCTWYSLLSGAAWSLFLLVQKGLLLVRLRFLITYLQRCLVLRQALPYPRDGRMNEEKIPFAIPIFTGTVLYLLSRPYP